jgi:acetyltransferase-like isoleucine patch superfamily enzyme
MKALLRKLVGWVRCFKVAYYTWYNKMYFGFRGIHFGDSMQVFNKIYVVGAKGKITIGNHFQFTSGDCINPLSSNLIGVICTGKSSTTITIGDYVGISSSRFIIETGLQIGDYVKIGANCLIIDTDSHEIDYKARCGQPAANPDDITAIVQTSPITIEDHAWIGANCIVLKGVTIGARTVIGAGSVVTKSIPADCIAAGNPCKVIRQMAWVKE